MVAVRVAVKSVRLAHVHRTINDAETDLNNAHEYIAKWEETLNTIKLNAHVYILFASFCS